MRRRKRSRLRSAAAHVWAQFELRDGLIYGGLVVLAIGLSWIYRPAGLVALGLGLYLIGYFGLPPLTETKQDQNSK